MNHIGEKNMLEKKKQNNHIEKSWDSAAGFLLL